MRRAVAFFGAAFFVQAPMFTGNQKLNLPAMGKSAESIHGTRIMSVGFNDLLVVTGYAIMLFCYRPVGFA
jgi:hypothetical protein